MRHFTGAVLLCIALSACGNSAAPKPSSTPPQPSSSTPSLTPQSVLDCVDDATQKLDGAYFTVRSASENLSISSKTQKDFESFIRIVEKEKDRLAEETIATPLRSERKDLLKAFDEIIDGDQRRLDATTAEESNAGYDESVKGLHLMDKVHAKLGTGADTITLCSGKASPSPEATSSG
jgi:hypothetical protein